jgi:hypothetical protein
MDMEFVYLHKCNCSLVGLVVVDQMQLLLPTGIMQQPLLMDALPSVQKWFNSHAGLDTKMV